MWLGSGSPPSFCGTGFSLNGFQSGTPTLSFTLTGNACFPTVVQDILTTGELQAAIRDASNTGAAITIPRTAQTTITIVGETPEPSTAVLLLAGLSGLGLLSRYAHR